jgi:2-keto-3-deoxy-L-rhamnonate aldolase RhmA
MHSVAFTSYIDVDAEFSVLPGLQDTAPEGKTWIDVANEHVAVIPQIESRLGVENLEEIMQVEGVDAISMYNILTFTDFRHHALNIVIGPSDLHLDLGSDTLFTATMERIHELSKKYKIPLVGFVYENTLTEKYKCGYRMLASAADMWILANGIEKSLKTGRELIEEARKEIIGNGEVGNPMC